MTPEQPATSPSAVIPNSHRDLLEAPLFGHLATIRLDGSPQSSVMWFAWDGSRLRFSHRSDRQKYQNLRHEHRVSFSVQDPDQPYRFLEVRGVVDSITEDPDAAFFVELQHRYGVSFPPYDADVQARVVIAIRPTRFVPVESGMTSREARDLAAMLERLPPGAV